jgi:hypothetical protein
MMKIGKNIKDDFSKCNFTVVDSCEGYIVVREHDHGYWCGSAYLLLDEGLKTIDTRKFIAENYNADFKERFGGIVGWLKKVCKTGQKRLAKIDELLESLEAEKEELTEFVNNINAL